ncbi:pyruvate kinase [Bradyrhizobium diazoefficiens]|jgi:pyruvate kinase|nr:hypothetical protein BD122_09720 [Bradyrhizobium diazoefficiens]
MACVVIGGVIRDHKGASLPGALLKISPLTKKDRVLRSASSLASTGLLSFVQKPSDLVEARALIGEAAGGVAKIETPMALDRIGI